MTDLLYNILIGLVILGTGVAVLLAIMFLLVVFAGTGGGYCG